MRAHRIYTRRTEARELREEAAERAFLRPHPDHISNAEEAEYRRPRVPPAPQNNGGLSYIANYSKALPHNYLGEVDQEAYRGLLRALHSGNPDHFEQIRLARPDKGLNLTNPQAGLAFDLEDPTLRRSRCHLPRGSIARSNPPRWASSTGWHWCGTFPSPFLLPVALITVTILRSGMRLRPCRRMHRQGGISAIFGGPGMRRATLLETHFSGALPGEIWSVPTSPSSCS
jgi:hypothetical protein